MSTFDKRRARSRPRLPRAPLTSIVGADSRVVSAAVVADAIIRIVVVIVIVIIVVGIIPAAVEEDWISMPVPMVITAVPVVPVAGIGEPPMVEVRASVAVKTVNAADVPR